MTHTAQCPYCPWTGRDDHQFLGQAKIEMYRHFDAVPLCANRYEKDNNA